MFSIAGPRFAGTRARKLLAAYKDLAGPNFVGANARNTWKVLQGIAGFAAQSQRPYRAKHDTRHEE